MYRIRGLVVPTLAMCAVVAASNLLVQFPVRGQLGGIDLADLLTFGAFTYPLAFLVNDLTNRALGPAAARRVVVAGFVLAVILSVWLATPRIAIASGTAFLVAQLLDASIFDRLRAGAWWKAPAVSSLLGAALDTVIFFSLAFSASFSLLGANDPFAIEPAPLLGAFAAEAPRWVSWALGDFAVKIAVTGVALLPYRVAFGLIRPWQAA